MLALPTQILILPTSSLKWKYRNNCCTCPEGQGTKGLNKMDLDVNCRYHVVNSTLFLPQLKNTQLLSGQDNESLSV